MYNNVTALISIFKFLPDKRKYLTFPIAFMVVSNIISLIIPLFAMKVIDQLKGNNTLHFKAIFVIMMAWFISLVLISLLDYYQGIAFRKYGNYVLSHLHSKIIEHYNQKSYDTWATQNSKMIAEEIKKDIEDLNPVISGDILLLIRHLLIIFITIILLIIINWKLFCSVALLFPGYIINHFLWDNKIKSLYKNYRKSGETFVSNQVEFLQTIPLMHIFQSSFYEMSHLNQRFSNLLNDQLEYFLSVTKRQTFTKIIKSIAPLYLAFIAFIFLYLNYATIGQIFAYWGIFTLTIASVSGISNLYIRILHSITVFQKLKEILLNKDDKKINYSNKIHKIHCIKCEDLAYRYQNQRTNLIEIPSFQIQRGEYIEIRGESGIGKTTLIKMIFGVIKPINGIIKINGMSLNSIDRQSFLSLIGYVEQNGYIYSRSLKDNILLGRKFEQFKWEQSLKLSRLNNFIKTLPDGCDQLLGENGLQISGGEKQRILIARALYHQPEWLFLDEPFTGIDIENQIEIKNLIELLRQKITIVLITHQKVPSLTVDKVINLEDR